MMLIFKFYYFSNNLFYLTLSISNNWTELTIDLDLSSCNEFCYGIYYCYLSLFIGGTEQFGLISLVLLILGRNELFAYVSSYDLLTLSIKYFDFGNFSFKCFKFLGNFIVYKSMFEPAYEDYVYYETLLSIINYLAFLNKIGLLSN